MFSNSFPGKHLKKTPIVSRVGGSTEHPSFFQTSDSSGENLPGTPNNTPINGWKW